MQEVKDVVDFNQNEGANRFISKKPVPVRLIVNRLVDDSAEKPCHESELMLVVFSDVKRIAEGSSSIGRPSHGVTTRAKTGPEYVATSP